MICLPRRRWIKQRCTWLKEDILAWSEKATIERNTLMAVDVRSQAKQSGCMRECM